MFIVLVKRLSRRQKQWNNNAYAFEYTNQPTNKQKISWFLFSLSLLFFLSVAWQTQKLRLIIMARMMMKHLKKKRMKRAGHFEIDMILTIQYHSLNAEWIRINKWISRRRTRVIRRRNILQLFPYNNKTGHMSGKREWESAKSWVIFCVHKSIPRLNEWHALSRHFGDFHRFRRHLRRI